MIPLKKRLKTVETVALRIGIKLTPDLSRGLATI